MAAVEVLGTAPQWASAEGADVTQLPQDGGKRMDLCVDASGKRPRLSRGSIRPHHRLVMGIGEVL